MAKSVREVVEAMMGSRDGVSPSVQAFPPVDREQLWRGLRLESRAAASKGSKDTANGTLDLAELDIDAEIEQRARKAAEEYEGRRNLYDARIRRANLSADQRATIEAAGRGALADFEAHLNEDQDAFTLAMREVRAREQEFQSFRSKHRLSRLPYADSPRRRILTYLLIALAVVAESIMNGLLFAKGSTAGIIGGVGQALMLSLINVGVAGIFALFGMPYWWHRTISLKLLGPLTTVLFAGWLPAWNLFIGHYRDLFVEEAGEVQLSQVWQRLASHPLGLGDAQSGMLVIFGMVVGFFVVVEIMRGKEHYPGFAAAGQKRARAIADYAALKADCIGRVKELRDGAVEDLEGAVAILRNGEFDRQLAVDGRSHLYKMYQAYLEHLASVRAWLIQRYEEAQNRSMSAVPRTKAEQEARAPSLVPAALPQVPEAQDGRGASISRIEQYITQLNEKFEATLRRYPPVDELITPDHSHRVSE